MNKLQKVISLCSVLLVTLFIGFVLIKIICKVQQFEDVGRLYGVLAVVIFGVGIVLSIYTGLTDKKNKIKFIRRF